jgi:hypothetical protein
MAPLTNDFSALKNAWLKTKEHQLLRLLEEEYAFDRPVCRSLVHLMHEFAEEYYGWQRGDQQIIYEAVDLREPSGKPMDDLATVPVKLTVSHPDDAHVLRKEGLSGLRRFKLLRLANEAYDQGGLLIQADLALLLTTSLRTIQRDVKEMRHAGIFVPTRGWVQESGHKPTLYTRCVHHYLDGDTPIGVAKKTGISEQIVQKAYRLFADTVVLYVRGYNADQIIEITGLPPRVAGEFLLLYETTGRRADSRLDDLFSTYTPGISQRPVRLERATKRHMP